MSGWKQLIAYYVLGVRSIIQVLMAIGWVNIYVRFQLPFWYSNHEVKWDIFFIGLLRKRKSWIKIIKFPLKLLILLFNESKWKKYQCI